MTIADRLRETAEYKKFIDKKNEGMKKTLNYIVERFREHPSCAQIYHFGKFGRLCNGEFGGASMDEVSSYLRDNGFNVERNCNGYGVYYLRITL